MKINAIFRGEPQERDVIGEPIREGGLAFYVIQLPDAPPYSRLRAIEPRTGFLMRSAGSREEMVENIREVFRDKGVKGIKAKIRSIAKGTNLNPHLEG